ncbi:MAG: hypothetical protein ACK5MU_04015 [Candidatus Saccharimonadales bacterium]
MKYVLFIIGVIGIIWSIWMLGGKIDNHKETGLKICGDLYAYDGVYHDNDFIWYAECYSEYDDSANTWFGWSLFLLIIGTPVTILSGIAILRSKSNAKATPKQVNDSVTG